MPLPVQASGLLQQVDARGYHGIILGLDGRRSYIPRRATAMKHELSRIESRE